MTNAWYGDEDEEFRQDPDEELRNLRETVKYHNITRLRLYDDRERDRVNLLNYQRQLAQQVAELTAVHAALAVYRDALAAAGWTIEQIDQLLVAS